MIKIIVACDPFMVIGRDGKLPWRMKEDLQLFRKRTMGHVLIMGRKTWESLPKKPLDGRANIVISRTKSETPVEPSVGAFWFKSIEVAIRNVREVWCGELDKYRTKDIFLIGGAEMFKYALERDLVDNIIMSRLHETYNGDVYFPKMDHRWITSTTEHHDGFDIIHMKKGTVNA